MSDNDKKGAQSPHRLRGPVTLAFMGDAVYEILVREYLIRKSRAPAGKLHCEAVGYVNAAAQARAAATILPLLTAEERKILRRGRNANTARVPKNAVPLDYRHATGLEALFGYLYLNGEFERIRALFEAIVAAREAASGAEEQRAPG